MSQSSTRKKKKKKKVCYLQGQGQNEHNYNVTSSELLILLKPNLLWWCPISDKPKCPAKRLHWCIQGHSTNSNFQ